jgi:hypothetical protein
MTAIRTLTLLIVSAMSLFLTKAFLDAAEESDFSVKRFSTNNFDQEVTQFIYLREPQAPLGKIMGAFRRNQKLSNDDTVYLKFDQTIVSVGDVFTIYSDLGPIKGLDNKFQKLGQKVMVKGYLQVTSVLPETIIGKIFDASSDIDVGDLVGPNVSLVHKVSPQEPSSDVRGRVIANAGENNLVGAYEFVFLDKGSKDGLKPNDKLVVFRTADGSAEIKPGLPEVTIAELIVINAEPRFSTAYVLSSRDSFERGAPFKADRSKVKFLE